KGDVGSHLWEQFQLVPFRRPVQRLTFRLGAGQFRAIKIFHKAFEQPGHLPMVPRYVLKLLLVSSFVKQGLFPDELANMEDEPVLLIVSVYMRFTEPAARRLDEGNVTEVRQDHMQFILQFPVDPSRASQMEQRRLD